MTASLFLFIYSFITWPLFKNDLLIINLRSLGMILERNAKNGVSPIMKVRCSWWCYGRNIDLIKPPTDFILGRRSLTITGETNMSWILSWLKIISIGWFPVTLATPTIKPRLSDSCINQKIGNIRIYASCPIWTNKPYWLIFGSVL